MIARMPCTDLREFRITVQKYYTYQRRKALSGAILTHHTFLVNSHQGRVNSMSNTYQLLAC